MEYIDILHAMKHPCPIFVHFFPESINQSHLLKLLFSLLCEALHFSVHNNFNQFMFEYFRFISIKIKYFKLYLHISQLKRGIDGSKTRILIAFL